MKFKSLIISTVRFQNFFWCLVWAVDFDVQITDEGRTFVHWVILSCDDIIEQVFGGGCFNILISTSVCIFLWLFSRCIMDIVSSIVSISCPSLRTCSENLDLPSA